MGQSVESRPAAERATIYRELAAEAMLMAERAASTNLRAGYLAMAAGWHKLAQEAEALAQANFGAPSNRKTEQDGDGDHSH